MVYSSSSYLNVRDCYDWPHNGWRSEEVSHAEHKTLCLECLQKMQDFTFWWSDFSWPLFKAPSTHVSKLHGVTSAFMPSGLRYLTAFLWIITVRTTFGLSHFWIIAQSTVQPLQCLLLTDYFYILGDCKFENLPSGEDEFKDFSSLKCRWYDTCHFRTKLW